MVSRMIMRPIYLYNEMRDITVARLELSDSLLMLFLYKGLSMSLMLNKSMKLRKLK